MFDQPTSTSDDRSIDTLARVIGQVGTVNGDHVTAVAGLTLHRRSAPNAPMPCIYGFGLGMVAQGCKQVMLNEEVHDYVAGHAMLTTVDLPVVSNVSEASTASPFLGLMLSLDPRMVLDVATEMHLGQAPKLCEYKPLVFRKADPALIAVLIRLVRLQNEPELASILGPLLLQEVIVRLLTSDFGPLLQHLIAINSPSQQIARSVNWLKQNFTQLLRVDELAARVHMSSSTFRQHFRSITGLSPVQYQKQLRLQEARQLMLSQDMDAGGAATRVGYDSPSQFSREYARLFGQPPLRDIQRIRLEH